MLHEDRPLSEEIKPKQATRDPLSTLAAYATAVLAILGLIGALLSTAGYGIALAVETELGMPHASLLKTNFDLLDLSVWFLVWLINNATQALHQIIYTETYWFTVFLISAFGFGMWVVLFGIFKFSEYLKKGDAPNNFFRMQGRTERRKFAIFSIMVTLISAFVGMTAMPLVLTAILFVSSLLGVIPALSMTAGVSHIHDYVVSPTRCSPTFTREQRLEVLKRQQEKKKSKDEAEKFATCVKVIDGDKFLGQGRVVFSTTGSVVLYDPKNGRVMRVATDGKTIEVLASI